MVTSPDWTPKVLSEYEVGRAVAAIEAIALLEKPITEVGCRRVSLSDLESDLRGCLIIAKADNVLFWTRLTEDRFRFGFYREAWVLDALDFLDRTDLGETERAWISGLLFGYRSSAIQQFIERTAHDESVTA